ncbi:hypothetical protein FAI40_01980 [Acetobacteraceae bacterium]|nr:hypothetical protein FAI40_01980 [Acetobacteraceae bacterium]
MRFILFCLFVFAISFEAVSAQEKSSLALPEGGGVIDEWFSHLPIDVMMGAKVTAAASEVGRVPWLYELFPSLKKIKTVPVGGMSAEEMLLLHPSLVVLPGERAGKMDQLEKMGLHVALMDFVDYAGLLACVKKSASLENTPLSLGRAEKYQKFLIENLGHAPVNMETTFCIPHGWKGHSREVSSGPKVLHISSLEPLKADGKETVIEEWIQNAGGQNVFTGKGNKKPITWEQVYAWNPDIIILQANAGSWKAPTVPKGAFLLKAAKENHIYRNPAGLFLWDRSGPELALQLLWAKWVMSGKTREDENEIKKKMRFFYKEFYDLKPSDEILEKILQGEAPDLV